MSILLALVFFAVPLDADIYDRLNELPRHLRSGGIPRDGIPAMSNPIPVTPAKAHYLTDTDLVLGPIRTTSVGNTRSSTIGAAAAISV